LQLSRLKKEPFNDEFKDRFKFYFVYIEALLNDWSGSTSIYSSFAISSNPDIIIFSDASGEFGYGALEVKSRWYGCGVWTDEEIASAIRKKAVSSTQLEIMAIVKAIKTFARPNCCVQIFADAETAIFILQKRYDKKSETSQA